MKLIKIKLLILLSILFFLQACKSDEEKAKELFFEQTVSRLDKHDLNNFSLNGLKFNTSLDSLKNILGDPQQIIDLKNGTYQYIYSSNKNLSFVIEDNKAKLLYVGLSYAGSRVRFSKTIFSKKSTMEEGKNLFPASYKLYLEDKAIEEKNKKEMAKNKDSKIQKYAPVGQSEDILKIYTGESNEKYDFLYFFYRDGFLNKIELQSR